MAGLGPSLRIRNLSSLAVLICPTAARGNQEGAPADSHVRFAGAEEQGRSMASHLPGRTAGAEQGTRHPSPAPEEESRGDHN